ncbi:hypothetical protein M422DRAFT_45134 [Sphaerobolus stellatus SS14]|nr:hypothetical protein M422DRAFT_45134 [Sphaerobolus stellatus SS14]
MNSQSYMHVARVESVSFKDNSILEQSQTNMTDDLGKVEMTLINLGFLDFSMGCSNNVYFEVTLLIFNGIQNLASEAAMALIHDNDLKLITSEVSKFPQVKSSCNEIGFLKELNCTMDLEALLRRMQPKIFVLKGRDKTVKDYFYFLVWNINVAGSSARNPIRNSNLASTKLALPSSNQLFPDIFGPGASFASLTNPNASSPLFSDPRYNTPWRRELEVACPTVPLHLPPDHASQQHYACGECGQQVPTPSALDVNPHH